MANREEQLKQITEQLEQGVAEIFTSEKYTEYLNTMAKFHNYSFNNTLLIAMQKPEATLVAGYQAWQKKFNRQVKRGEKGIQIIALYRLDLHCVYTDIFFRCKFRFFTVCINGYCRSSIGQFLCFMHGEITVSKNCYILASVKESIADCTVAGSRRV